MDTNVIKYPYLPEGKTILFVSENHPFMTRAKEVRNTQSTDKKHPTGAVVVKNNVVLGEAANQSGYKHKILIKWHEKWMCFRRWIKAKSGTKYWLCPGCATNKNHAETLAVMDAISKNGKEAIAGGDLYLYGHWWCCEPCWRAMIDGGIENVYLAEGAHNLFSR